MVCNRIFSLVLLFGLFTPVLFGQVGQDRYLVYFSDKENTPFSLDAPEAYLSQRAIDRRNNQNILIDLRDLPVDPAYIQQVRDLGDVLIVYQLKWFNAILIETTDQNVLDALDGLGIVEAVEGSPVLTSDDPVEYDSSHPAQSKSNVDYGAALNQIEMLNGLQLHEDGFRGAGKWIGVFDGGFGNSMSASVLDPLFASDRVLGMVDFVHGGDFVFGYSTHGSAVLSTMAADQPQLMIGTAPDASYLLCITEDVSIERRIEEANWVAAAAYADSMGIDIINTSLSYTLFDSIADNYSYADMDGNTTLITRGSDVAASRGILIVTSAGNQGNSPWYYISAPADGDSVLAVGAVNAFGNVVSFSSRGPSFDGRVKPNVMAQGAATAITNLGDSITFSNGTSFSGPVLCGMAASLWQAFPTATAWEVHQAIEQSAHVFSNPNDSLGYGIPDFEIARDILATSVSTTNQYARMNLTIYPNPASDEVRMLLPQTFSGPATLSLVDVAGRVVYQQNIQIGVADENLILTRALQRSEPGLYVVQIQSAQGEMLTGKVLWL